MRSFVSDAGRVQGNIDDCRSLSLESMQSFPQSRSRRWSIELEETIEMLNEPCLLCRSKCGFEAIWLLLRCQGSSFFFYIGSFDPPCVRSPLDTLESGVLFHIMVVETFTCFTRRSTMESSVVSSLPDHAFIPNHAT